MSRKRKNYVDDFASMGKNDTFGMIYEGMVLSKAYKKLPIGAKHFYTLCRVQAQSKRGKSCLWKHGQEYGITYNKNDFVFPSSHLALYGIDRANAKRYFDDLEKAGFIVKKENNKVRWRTNVYSFSDKWAKSV